MAIKFSGLKNIKGQVKIKNKNSGNNSIIQNPNVYSGSRDDTVKKIDSSGNELWSYSTGTSLVFGVAVDQSGSVYAASFNDNEIIKLDSAGNHLWTFTGHTGSTRSVAVDPGLYPIFWS